MMREVLFYLVVLISNAVQAATGFAGTMLAMAPSLQLLGADAAIPLLSAFSFLVSVVLTARNWRSIDFPHLWRILVCMLLGLIAGMWLNRVVAFDLLLPAYGIFLILYALYKLFLHREISNIPVWAGVGIMLGAGVLQALFLSGGALLVIYAAAVLPDKDRFRATLSPVWVLTNAILLVEYALQGRFTGEVLRIGAIGLVPLALGILLGNLLHKRIPQPLFLKICFALLFINGVWLLVK